MQIKARKEYFFFFFYKIEWLSELKDAGYFNPDQNPKPLKSEDGYFITFWGALCYVERISTIAKSRYKIDLILSIINNLVEYRENGEKIDNPKTDLMILKILCNMPSEISMDHIRYLKYSLESSFRTGLIADEIGRTLIPNLIEFGKEDLLIELISVVTEYKVNDKSSMKIEPLIEEYWFKEIIDKNIDSITNLAAQGVFDIVISRITEIYKINKHVFSQFSIETIDNPTQNNYFNEYGSYLIKILVNSINKIPHEILLRVAIYFIGNNFDEFKELFFKYEKNPFNLKYCNHEIYQLMSKNSKKFNDNELNWLIDLIEKKEYFFPDNCDADKIEKEIAFNKKKLLSPLLSSENIFVRERYDYYNSINNTPIKNPDLLIKCESWTGDVSPITKEEIIIMSSEELVEYFTKFKEEEGIRMPSEMGLADNFVATIVYNPERFCKEIHS